jgi:hypothetical protein
MTTRRQEKRQSNLLIRCCWSSCSRGYLALAVLGRGGIGALFAQPPAADIPKLWEFWHAHRAAVNSWRLEEVCRT